MIIVIDKVVCRGIKEWSVRGIDRVAAEVLIDPGLGLVYELGSICDKVRWRSYCERYTLRTSAHMDSELSRCGLDSRVKEVYLCFVYVIKWFNKW
jgi:hypothetical protein